jgi:Asp-tRNA(Asn)/Glu-tRNA(Gln) amidotransferase A subunit family amidase
VDVLASPTTPILPPEWGDGYLDDLSIFEVVGNTGPFNLTGHPAVSVPCGRHEGLPIGLQFVADDDATALAAAATWEALAPEVGL